MYVVQYLHLLIGVLNISDMIGHLILLPVSPILLFLASLSHFAKVGELLPKNVFPLPLTEFPGIGSTNHCAYDTHGWMEMLYTATTGPWSSLAPSKWLMCTSHSCSALLTKALPQRLCCQSLKDPEHLKFTKRELLQSSHRLF
jgi:hypothetical protein